MIWASRRPFAYRIWNSGCKTTSGCHFGRPSNRPKRSSIALSSLSRTKNIGNNREKRTFVRNNNNPRQTESGDVKMITATEINAVMPSTAAAVYGLDPVKHAKDLQLWSSHSLRVGTCVVLHAHGFTGPQIQFLLRWKSDAFMANLRNLGFLATQQTVALSESCDMPNLL
jgi:hypothetical protein